MTDETPTSKFQPERYRDYLHFLARMRLRKGSPAPFEASDVVHDALLRAHRNRHQFRGETEAEWRGWLRSILARALADAFRVAPDEQVLDKSSARLEDFLPQVESTPSQKLDREEQILLLAEALTKLLDDERTTLELRFFQDPPWSFAEIAAHLNRTAKAVADLNYRALRRLRGFLQQTT